MVRPKHPCTYTRDYSQAKLEEQGLQVLDSDPQSQLAQLLQQQQPAFAATATPSAPSLPLTANIPSTSTAASGVGGGGKRKRSEAPLIPSHLQQAKTLLEQQQQNEAKRLKRSVDKTENQLLKELGLAEEEKAVILLMHQAGQLPEDLSQLLQAGEEGESKGGTADNTRANTGERE